jgi:hypothetical protein
MTTTNDAPTASRRITAEVTCWPGVAAVEDVIALPWLKYDRATA